MNHSKPKHEKRVMYTLPSYVVRSVETYARQIRKGNTSGFVADAIEAYIKLWKKGETERLSNSYRAAAKESLKVAKEWEFANAEVDKFLEELESKK